MSPGATAAGLPLQDLPGLDPQWSRTVDVVDATGRSHTWHYLDNGAEPTAGTMLCVHGNPTWSYLWRRFLTAAPAGWRVVAVDQLGMGYSDRTETPRDLEQRIDDLGRFCAAAGVGTENGGPLVAVAHDWGGPVTLGWAERRPEPPAGLILTNTGVAQPADVDPPALLRLAGSRALHEAVCVRTPTFVRGATALSRPPLPVAVRNAFARPYASPARRRAVGDFVADIPFAPDHPSRATLDGVADGLAALRDVPTLLLWGPRDPVFSEAFLRDVQQRLPHAVVHRYPRASHLVTEDVPEAAEHAWTWVAAVRSDATAPTPTAPTPTAPTPTAPTPTRPPTVGAALDATLLARADDPATAVVELTSSRRTGHRRTVTSWRDLAEKVAHLAGGLREAGVRPGQRVALLVPPGVDLTAAVYACWRLGAVIVVADAGLGLRPLADALRSAGPDHVIGIAAGLGVVRALGVPGRRILAGRAPAAVRRALQVATSLDELADLGRAGDPVPPAKPTGQAAVLFTSGATGPPKGVVYRHDQLRMQVELVREVMGIGPTDRLVAAFAPFALYGPAMGVGVAVPDMDVTRPATLTATALAEAVAAVEGTVVFASPAALRNVAATADDLPTRLREALLGVRRVLSAGAPVPLPLLRRIQELLPSAELHTPYGMTEVLPVADIDLPGIEAAGPGNGVCVGRTLPGVEVRVSPLGPTGQADGELTTVPGVTGEVCVSAAHVKDRYDRLWATERAASRNPGWHRTGDVGHLDDDGRLWVEGRLVHVITTPDGPVTPVGIEQRVEALEGVVAAAAVGVGPAGTQPVVLVVVPVERPSEVLADPVLAGRVRAAAGVPVAAVLLTAALPVDIRHASKVDRTRLSRWAGRVLSGGRPGRV